MSAPDPVLPTVPALRSLGLWSDLWVLGPGSRVEPLEDPEAGPFLAVRTPSNPTFRWGNLIVFRRPMRAADAAVGRRLFAERIGTPPTVRHVSLAWDDPAPDGGAAAALEADGFRAERTVVLTLDGGAPEAPRPEGVTLRALDGDDDWRAALELQTELVDGDDAYRAFRAVRNGGYRAMIDAGAGAWFGAFAGSRLVANLGIFAHGGVARYQAVETHPEWRRRGVASALLALAARFARERLEARRLVILAEPDEGAIRLYRRLGFRDAERLLGFEIRDVGAAGDGQTSLPPPAGA